MAKIMVVEDDQSLREIYSIRLTAEGFEVVSAGDGEEALAIAVKERPDLIISDVMMPKISGFDMLDILRSTPETKNIKVIMMTALSSEDQRKRGENLGADKYLVKSQVGIEDVISAVREVLGIQGGGTGGAGAAVAGTGEAAGVGGVDLGNNNLSGDNSMNIPGENLGATAEAGATPEAGAAAAPVSAIGQMAQAAAGLAGQAPEQVAGVANGVVGAAGQVAENVAGVAGQVQGAATQAAVTAPTPIQSVAGAAGQAAQGVAGVAGAVAEASGAVAGAADVGDGGLSVGTNGVTAGDIVANATPGMEGEPTAVVNSASTVVPDGVATAPGQPSVAQAAAEAVSATGMTTTPEVSATPETETIAAAGAEAAVPVDPVTANLDTNGLTEAAEALSGLTAEQLQAEAEADGTTADVTTGEAAAGGAE